MPLLSIIIPFGTSIQREYIEQRVINKAKQFCHCKDIECIFVEGFSSSKNNLKDIIESYGHKYFKDNKQENAFSSGSCRNLGVIMSSYDVIMFLDVDYHLSLSMLDKILQIIKVKNIHKNTNAFFVLPCAFLTQNGSEILQSYDEKLWDSLVQSDLNTNKQKFIKFYAPASSSIVMNRFKYLEIGGNDSSFVGHGYEDFDLLARILKLCADFEKLPNNLAYDARSWFFDDFKGFRAWFSLLGEEAKTYGVLLYHFWHVEPNQNGYLDNREINHQKFYKNLAAFKNYRQDPNLVPCLFDKNANNNLLVFTPENGAVYFLLRGFSVFLGRLMARREYEFFQDDEFLDKKLINFIKENNISFVILVNPYGNEKRLAIYNFLQQHNINFICFDRGCLPDSWFFDTKGFNYDSVSYNEKFWNKALEEDTKLKTQEYIKQTLSSEIYLEKNGEHINVDVLKRKLAISTRKIVFVPLQVQSDTVVKYYTYEPFSWSGFLQIINELAGEFIQDNVVFVAKKHPLTIKFDEKQYPNIIFAPQDTNFLDLINMCDACVLLNSRVGVYAMMANKPCVLCANAFYHFDEINLQAKNKQDLQKHLKQILNGNFIVNTDKVLRFIAYLKDEFYSFANPTMQEVKNEKENRIVNRTIHLDFYKIRFNGKSYLECDSTTKFKYTLKSNIYKPYIYQINTIKTTSNKISEKAIEKISQTKFYRLFKKLLTRPKDFVMDSKNPFIKPFKKFIRQN